MKTNTHKYKANEDINNENENPQRTFDSGEEFNVSEEANDFEYNFSGVPVILNLMV